LILPLPTTVARRGERLYIDSNILVYYFYTKQRNDLSKKAQNLLQKIESAKFEGVISSFTLMEVMKSLRELLIKYGNVRKVTDIENIIREQIFGLFAIRNIRFVEGRPPDFTPMSEVKELLFCKICNEAFSILCKCTGKPDYDQETGQVVHKGLHAPDILHIVLAKELQCDKLATFEWNFREAQKEIVPLILQDRNTFW